MSNHRSSGRSDSSKGCVQLGAQFALGVAGTLVAAVVLVYLVPRFPDLPALGGKPRIQVDYRESDCRLTISGTGFRAGEIVRVKARYGPEGVEYPLVTLIADANGCIHESFTWDCEAQWQGVEFTATGDSTHKVAVATANPAGLPAKSASRVPSPTRPPGEAPPAPPTQAPIKVKTFTPTAVPTWQPTSQPQPPRPTETATPFSAPQTPQLTPLAASPTPEHTPVAPLGPTSLPPTEPPGHPTPEVHVSVRPGKIKPGENFIVRVEFWCACTFDVEVACPASTAWCNYESGPRSYCGISERNQREHYLLDLTFHCFKTALGAKSLDVTVNGVTHSVQVNVSRE